MRSQARQALTKLGKDIAIARSKCRISTASIGVYASVLAILGLSESLSQIADRLNDSLGLDLDEEHLPKKSCPLYRNKHRRRRKRQ